MNQRELEIEKNKYFRRGGTVVRLRDGPGPSGHELSKVRPRLQQQGGWRWAGRVYTDGEYHNFR